MQQLAQFQDRLAAIGDFCSRAQGERALALTLRAMSASSGGKASRSMREALPSWLQPSWDEAVGSRPRLPVSDDLVGSVAHEGGYAYRAAAERVVTAVFACLGEYMDEQQVSSLLSLLPRKIRDLFGYAGASVYDASVCEFL